MLSGPLGLARPLRGGASGACGESRGLGERTEQPQLRHLTSKALDGQSTTSLARVSGRWWRRDSPLFGNSGIDIRRPQSQLSATTGRPSISPATGWTRQEADLQIGVTYTGIRPVAVGHAVGHAVTFDTPKRTSNAVMVPSAVRCLI